MTGRIISALVMILYATTAHGAVNTSVLKFQENISSAVARIRPSVVSVRANKKMQAGQNGVNDIRWYESIGAGFVVDERGYVLTNYHVVNGGENISVSFWHSGNNRYTATLIDKDAGNDLALLKVASTERFIPVSTADSDQLEIGDYVICIGSPFGLNHSVSLGIVSDLHRKIVVGTTSYADMIQTDAVINEGNSGGPMIDIYGRVVGVSTAIYAPNGTYTGIGFAIPSNRLIRFITTNTKKAVPSPFRAVAVQATKKSPVNLHSKMPGDRIHQTFSDCRTCHTIKQKTIASYKSPIPHKMAGPCSDCHIMTNDKVTKGPIAVAAILPLKINTVEHMPYSELFLTVIIKIIPIILVTSIILSMIGVGGGFIYVPVLIACGVDFHTATTTSLIMLASSQVTALYNYFRSGFVDIRTALILEGPTMIGAFAGGMLAHYFNVNALTIVFACALFMASYFMMNENYLLQSESGNNRFNSMSPFCMSHTFRDRTVTIDVGVAAPVVFVVGYIGGMLGFAGGWLKIPVMVLLFNIPMKVAVATSSFMVPFTGIAGFLGHSIAGHCEPRLAATLSVVTMIGAYIGSKTSIGTKSNQLRIVFAFILSVVGLWMVAKICFI